LTGPTPPRVGGFDAVVFDLDGTLVDSAPSIFACLHQAFDEVGQPRLPRAVEARLLGPPLHRALLPHLGPEATAAVVQAYRRLYGGGGLDDTVLFPGVRDMLEALAGSGLVLAVGTNKPEPFAVRICRNLSISHYFRVVCGDTMDGARASKVEVLREVDQRLGGGTRAAMVGDRVFDVQAALELGWTSVGVAWGYGDAEELEGAAYVAERPSDLSRCLLYLGSPTA
jgi:phosphoglycolate phosphatase